MYVAREIEQKLASYLHQFKVVLVTGPRQVGKTTMLKHALESEYQYVTLDDLNVLSLALDDPGAALSENRTPIIIDEVQQAPDLFRQAKYVADSSENYGSIVLTGSQTYALMQGVSESLAGRVGILEMSGLSLRELGSVGDNSPYVPREISAREVCQIPHFNMWAHIQRGAMPRLQSPDVDWDAYYTSYVRSYLERDVRQLINIKDERKLFNFMVAVAARTGQILNASDISNVVDVDVKTVQGWLSALQASGIIHILQPFWANSDKRLSKTPKVYFMDTGLACHLTGWNTPEQLKRGAMAGHMFETFVVGEVLKSYLNAGRDTRAVTFYRDARKREIDLVIQDGHVLHPVEIKAGVNVRKDATKHFSALADFGHVVCQTDEPYLISREVQAVPPWAI